jgi:hypothetical protein
MNLFPLLLIALAFAADDPVVGPLPVYVLCDKLSADSFAWEWSGLDSAGNPTTANRTVYRFRREVDGVPVPDDRVIVVIDGEIAPGTTKHKLSEVLAAVPLGRYRADLQLRSPAGVWGGFSQPLLVEVVDGTPPPPVPVRGPAPPTAFRVERGTP